MTVTTRPKEKLDRLKVCLALDDSSRMGKPLPNDTCAKEPDPLRRSWSRMCSKQGKCPGCTARESREDRCLSLSPRAAAGS